MRTIHNLIRVLIFYLCMTAISVQAEDLTVMGLKDMFSKFTDIWLTQCEGFQPGDSTQIYDVVHKMATVLYAMRPAQPPIKNFGFGPYMVNWKDVPAVGATQLDYNRQAVVLNIDTKDNLVRFIAIMDEENFCVQARSNKEVVEFLLYGVAKR